ncbi:MAG: penicillin-binding protein 1B [Oligoflexus sp.]
MKKNLWRRRFMLIGLPLLGIVMVALLIFDFQVRQKFEGKKWKLPSLVYGRPLEIYPGANINLKMLEEELAESQYSRMRSADRPGTYSVRGRTLQIFRRGFDFWDGSEEPIKVEIELAGKQIARVSADGGDIALIRLEPLLIGGIYPDRFEDRKLIRLEQAPEHLLQALIQTEDQHFYQHFGVDFKGIARATLANIKARAYVQGASTLTQQLVKNFYLNAERSLKRKLYEAIYAVVLEARYSKDEILEAYLNEIYLGQQGDRAIHGFGLGSEFYFGTPVDQLSLAQAATLVAIINGPSYYNPRRHPERCLGRRNLILDKMLEAGVIDSEAHEQAINEPLDVQPSVRTQSLLFPAYIDLVKRHLNRDYMEDDLQQEGLRIFTSFDPQVQWSAEQSLDRFLQGMGMKELEGAIVVASSSADVEAVVGSRQPGFAGFNRALDIRRSIGSLVKPAILLAALQESERFHLSSFIEDAPMEVKLSNGQVWQPRNYDRLDHGMVPLYQVISKSLNQSSAKLGLQVGTKKVAEVLQQLGVSHEIPTNPAMLLGAFGMSPFEVLQFFQTLSSGGFQRPLRSVRYVMTSEGTLMKAYPPETRRVFDSGLIHLVQYALQSVMTEGTGMSAYRVMPADLLSAGKTGTSDERRDSWFAGYTGDKIGVVWLGLDNNQPTPLTGASGSLQVWAQLMARISSQSIHLTKPQNVVYEWVEEKTGLLGDEHCAGMRQLPFIEGTAPTERADSCRRSEYPVVDWIKRFFE